MSTRAGIIVKDGYDEIHFYRHSDGYPEGTLPTLEKFLDLVKKGFIRDNASQAAGWLIMIGADEYKEKHVWSCPKCNDGVRIRGQECPQCGTTAKIVTFEKTKEELLNPEPVENSLSGWKVGAYEPTRNVHKHGDLEYIYTIDLKEKTIKYRNA